MSSESSRASAPHTLHSPRGRARHYLVQPPTHRWRCTRAHKPRQVALSQSRACTFTKNRTKNYIQIKAFYTDIFLIQNHIMISIVSTQKHQAVLLPYPYRFRPSTLALTVENCLANFQFSLRERGFLPELSKQMIRNSTALIPLSFYLEYFHSAVFR